MPSASLKPTTAGVTDEQFGEGLAGDALEEAGDALRAGLVAFFPPGKRVLIENALAKARASEAARGRRHARLDSPAVRRRFEHELIADTRFAGTERLIDRLSARRHRRPRPRPLHPPPPVPDGERPPPEAWERTSLLAALIHNQWKKKPQMKEPDELNP